MAGYDTHIESRWIEVGVKRIFIAVFSVLFFSVAVAAQTVSCYTELETCPENYPPEADVFLHGQILYWHFTDIFERDAVWYFFDDSSEAWSTLEDAEIVPFTKEAFDEAFDELGWEAYLADADTAIAMSVDGNAVYVMDEEELHLIDLSKNLVFSIRYSEYATYCTAPDGTAFDFLEDAKIWYEVVEKGATWVARCKYGFRRTTRYQDKYIGAQLRTINDPGFIKAGVLKVLDPSSPFYEEKTRYSVEYQRNPPEIWLYDYSTYGPGFGIYLKLDGDYDDDLENDTIAMRSFETINLHDRLVQWEPASQDVRRDFGGIKRKRQARSALVNVLERALTLTPAKWLLKVETGDDNGLYYNLSSLFKYVGN